MSGWDFALETYKELLEDAIKSEKKAHLHIKEYRAKIKEVESKKEREEELSKLG